MNANDFGHLFARLEFGFFGLWFLFILSLIACRGIQQVLRNRAPHRPWTDGELPPCCSTPRAEPAGSP